jgi:hypothetical protein
MKKSIELISVPFVIILLICGLMCSCSKDILRGAGNIRTRDISLAGFHSVETHYDIDAEIIYGANYSIKASGYENLLNELDFKVVNGILQLKFNTRYPSIRNSNIKAVIQMPVLSGLSIHGSGKISAMGFEQGETLQLLIHGSGDIEATQSKYKLLKIGIYGSGDTDAKNLLTENAEVKMHGSGNVYVKPSNLLKAEIHGSGNIYYQGNPAIESERHGSGRIIKR